MLFHLIFTIRRGMLERENEILSRCGLISSLFSTSEGSKNSLTGKRSQSADESDGLMQSIVSNNRVTTLDLSSGSSFIVIY
jgi:hypothetical protein